MMVILSESSQGEDESKDLHLTRRADQLFRRVPRFT